MRIQSTNSPNIQYSTFENSAARQENRKQQKDVFESKIESQQQAASSKQEKAENDYAIGNIELIGNPLVNETKTESSHSAFDEARDWFENHREDTSQDQQLKLQQLMQQVQAATTKQSETQKKFSELLKQLMGNIKA